MKRLVLTLTILAGFALGGVAQSLHYDFEDGTLQGWTTLDGDGDGHCWEPSIGGMGHNSNGMVMAYSKDYATGDSLAPNEYLVSPRLVLSEDWPVIRFYACALDETYPAEHFGVSISTTVNDDPLAFTLLSEWTIAAKDAENRQGNWYNYTVDLSAYTGQEVYVAIRHHYCSGQSAICVDDIQIDGTIQQDGLVISPDILTFEEPWVPQTFTISNQTDSAVTISSINVEPDDNVVLLSGQGLPRTLQPNETMNVEVYVNGIGYKGYLTYYVNVATSIGYRQVTVRVNEEAWDEGLLWMPMQGLTFDENSPLTQDFYLYNTNALDSITIYELYEDGTDYLELVPSHSLPYVIPPHESLYIDVTLINFPENTTNVNIYSSSSLGQGSSPYVHIVGGLTPSSGELVITPDTLWFENNTAQMVTITNESNEAVVVSEFNQPSNAHPYATIYYENQPIYNVLPLTLQPNQSIEVAIFFVEPPYPGKSDYVSSYIDIVSSVGNKRITLMASESIFGGLLYFWDIWLNGTNPEPEVVYNYYLSDITINDIYEVGTDFLIIETEESLPVSLPMVSGFEFTVRLRENLKGYVDTQICVSTSQGDSFIPVHISIANGILTRVPAPYFEQNVCDTRLAIVSGEETFYVTVDDFWPNPNLDALVVHYDTIPIGTAIDVSGTIKTMSDELGNPFYVIDIQETTAHYYDAITSLLKGWPEEYVYIQPTVSPSQIYYLTINGERQTWPLVFNGVTYEDFDLLTFIGHCSIQTDSIGNQFMGMELQDIQPFRDYTFELEDGTLSTNYWNPLYLSAPFEDQHFLTFLWGDFTFPSPFYPMHNGQFYKGSFINNDIFREGMHVDLKGIEHIRYDIYGSEVNTVEIVEMDTEEETTLTGTVEMAPIPNTGNNPLPVPGVMVAFKANERTYYLENPQDYSGSEWFLVGNDTIYSGQEITATFTSKMLIDNGLNFYYRININEAEVLDPILPPGAEWYYEIENENGSITYQYMYQAGDTVVGDEPSHILVKINTLYDKDLHQDVTHEYVYERDGKVYWWNKTLEEFTVLYDFGAQEGDSWTIKVGMETLIMHVNSVETIEYEGKTYRMLHVSDADDIFSGDIVCGIGHLTSFFPERLMDNGDGIRVEGLRCYWVEDELVFKYGDEDCDAIISDLHGMEENGPSTGSGTFTIYPNPTNGVLTIHHSAFFIQHSSFRITNLMGQTVLSGQITAETQQINVSSLPQGMYFITFAGETRKFVVR